MNSTSPLALCRIRNKKGWSTLNVGPAGRSALSQCMTPPVAAAASVPFSSTRTKALWNTSRITTRCWALTGLAMPVKQAYLNAHIPSAQRATILSLDSMFADIGGVAGQSGWGWLARMRSIGEAWAWSGATLLFGLPLYWLARRRNGKLDRI